MTEQAPLIKRLHVDPADRRYTFEYIQDVQPVLDQNHALRSMPQKSDFMRHVASIPTEVYLAWLHEAWERGYTTARPFTREFEDEVVTKKLNDPDWKHLRVDR